MKIIIYKKMQKNKKYIYIHIYIQTYLFIYKLTVTRWNHNETSPAVKPEPIFLEWCKIKP
jgi:hypothetical protein